jgi:enoyl-CoA hydratase
VSSGSARVRGWKEDALYRIRLDDAKRKNVLDPEVMTLLAGCLAQAEGDPEVRVVVLDSPVEGFFSAGVDIGFLAGSDPEAFEARDTLGTGEGSAWRALGKTGKPVITIVRGYALGGGLELALAADILVLGRKAVLGLPEIRLGLMPGLGGTQRMVALAGPHRAAGWVLTGGVFSAEEAFAAGVGTVLVEDGEAEAEGVRLARILAGWSEEALKEACVALRAAQTVPLDEGLEKEKQGFYRLLRSSGAQAGMQAFLHRHTR